MTFPDAFHDIGGTHRGTEFCAELDQRGKLTDAVREHIADGHFHCPECESTDFEVDIPATFTMRGKFIEFTDDSMAITLRCTNRQAGPGHFQVLLGAGEAFFVPEDALSTLGAAIDAVQDKLRSP